MFLISGKCFSQDTLGLADKYKCDSFKVNGKWNYIFCVPEIPALQAKITTLENQVIQLINTPPPSASIPILIPVIVSGNAYTIKPTDHGNAIMCNTSCTVTAPSGLPTGFTCRIIRKGGEVTIAGTYKSANGWRRISQQYRDATIIYDGIDLILSGNLK